MVYRHADRNRNVYARKKHIIKKAEREAAALSLSRSDRWQANFLIEKLNSTLPEITYIDYDQSLKNFASPTKAYERLALEEKIIDPNPVIFWQLQNVMIKPDVNNNYKPLKEYKSSTKRIDGIITSIMARDRCEAAHKAAPAVSFDTILHSF